MNTVYHCQIYLPSFCYWSYHTTEITCQNISISVVETDLSILRLWSPFFSIQVFFCTSYKGSSSLLWKLKEIETLTRKQAVASYERKTNKLRCQPLNLPRPPPAVLIRVNKEIIQSSRERGEPKIVLLLLKWSHFRFFEVSMVNNFAYSLISSSSAVAPYQYISRMTLDHVPVSRKQPFWWINISTCSLKLASKVIIW